MDKKNYFIKNGYKNQTANTTFSVLPTDLYWTKERVNLSRYYQFEAYTTARKLLKNKSASAVDVGCGAAVKLMEVIYPRTKNVTGIDQEEAISYCKKAYKGGAFIVDNLEKPKSSPGKFDVVICADVIEHMENPDKLLSFLKKLAKKDGYIVISTPERDLLRGKNCMASPKPEHIREWNKRELATYLENQGLIISSHTMIPLAKSSLFNKEIRSVLRKTLQLAGTVNVNQLVVCKLGR